MNKKSDLSWLPSLKVPHRLKSSDYEFSGDREALAAFKSIPGAALLFTNWVQFWLEFRKTGFLGSTVKVSEKQFPEVNKLRLRAAEILDLKPPPLFIMESPVINAYTMGTDEENSFVVITRQLLEQATEREVMFILGHEMGHIKSQHALYATIAIYLANMGLFYGYRFPPIQLLIYPLELALKAWFRRSEITCDRAGLLCTQDLNAGRKALLLLGCCSRELADEIDLEEFRNQSADVAGSYGKWSELFLTHPYLPKRIRCLEIFAESHMFLRRIRLDAKTKFMDTDDCDAAVNAILGNTEPVMELMQESGDLERIKVVLALAGGWSEGNLKKKKREALSALMDGLELGHKELRKLRLYLDKELTEAQALREIKYFTGKALNALPYAFSYTLMDCEGVRYTQARLLAKLAAACGVAADGVDGLLYDVGARKTYFRANCGTDICAHCARLFGKDESACPGCGRKAGNLITPENIKIKRLSEKFDDLRNKAAKTAGEAGAGFLRVLAKGLQASSEALSEKPRPRGKRTKE